jgi:ERCC4-type nuclease
VSGAELPILSIFAKLSMLSLTFPGLQVIWSSGPEHTADLFEALRSTQPLADPDLHRIFKIGKVALEADKTYDDDLEIEGDESEDFKRYLPTEFLRRFTGISQANINEVIKRCRNIVEVCNMTEEEWIRSIGERAAREVCKFINGA